MASKKRRTQQAPKPRNPELAKAMQELRQGSRTSLHRDMSKYDRSDNRRKMQAGRYETY